MIHLAILMSLFAAATSADTTRMTCATHELTTSYSLIEKADGFELQVLHHNGTDYMPINEGIITSQDLPMIAEKSKLFAQMGARYNVKFEKSDCKVGEGEVTCSLRKPLSVGAIDIESFWFSLSKRRIETKYVKYDSYLAEISIRTDKQSYSSPMEYPATHCTLR